MISGIYTFKGSGEFNHYTWGFQSRKPGVSFPSIPEELLEGTSRLNERFVDSKVKHYSFGITDVEIKKHQLNGSYAHPIITANEEVIINSVSISGN